MGRIDDNETQTLQVPLSYIVDNYIGNDKILVMAWKIELDWHALGHALEVVKHGYYYDTDNYYDYKDSDFESVADY